jgi:hypothetical protein
MPADGTSFTTTTTTTTTIKVTPRHALPNFVLTAMCLGFEIPIAREDLITMLSRSFLGIAESYCAVSQALAHVVRAHLYPNSTIAPDHIDVLARLGVTVCSFDPAVYEASEPSDMVGVRGGDSWGWMPTRDGSLRILLNVTSPEHVQRQDLTSAIGQAVLLRFGLELDDIIEDHAAVHAAEIGRWILIPPALLDQVVGDLGDSDTESFTNERFDHAYASLKRITCADEDTCLNTLIQHLTVHFGHELWRSAPISALPAKAA